MQYVEWVKKRWALPVLYGLTAWETVALGTRRIQTISRFASRHPMVTVASLGMLWAHFVRYVDEQP